jgi:hypothetical protein
MEGMIGDVPWCIGYSSEKFGLIPLDDSYVELDTIFEHDIHVSVHYGIIYENDQQDATV